MLVRIDEATKIVLDKEEFAPDGSLVSEVRFDEIRFVRAVPPSHFALPKQYARVHGPAFGEPSEDLDRVVRGAGFAAREPRSLPDGFSPVEGNLVELRGVVTVHFLYSDGIRTVSLFENVKSSTLDMTRFQPQTLQVDGRDAQYAEDGSTALLAWSDGDAALHAGRRAGPRRSPPARDLDRKALTKPSGLFLVLRFPRA